MKPSDKALPPRLHEDLVLLAGHLLSCASGLVEEPAYYGIFRCMDSARRTLEVLAEHAELDPRLAELRDELERTVSGAQNGQSVEEFLDDVCLRMARIVKEGAEERTPSVSV
ncbi:hypothetical protein E0L36_00400 [Streptomyces sp. AJS327]|uniref:DUF6092 family protein n=1 Tax=Streptomyces sp. AJS327 TaxID=2545265 RepID=UPI0015DF623E|nr:DUF6092 family protein [Streptomyces sp. AJS327]MBA0049427.1 hypothetical protein [Streptomyces sp. AJS327]